MRQLFSSTISPLLLLGLSVSLVACGMLEEEPPAAVEESKILLAEEDPDAVQGVALDDDGNIVSGELEIDSEDALGDGVAAVSGAAAGQGMTVYFDYDSTEIKPRYAEILQLSLIHI